jgi:hypothetical protein
MSSYMILRFMSIETNTNKPSLTPLQKEILIGILLGDG